MIATSAPNHRNVPHQPRRRIGYGLQRNSFPTNGRHPRWNQTMRPRFTVPAVYGWRVLVLVAMALRILRAGLLARTRRGTASVATAMLMVRHRREATGTPRKTDRFPRRLARIGAVFPHNSNLNPVGSVLKRRESLLHCNQRTTTQTTVLRVGALISGA